MGLIIYMINIFEILSIILWMVSGRQLIKPGRVRKDSCRMLAIPLVIFLLQVEEYLGQSLDRYNSVSKIYCIRRI